MMFDPIVLRSKTAYMQAVSTLVGLGYCSFVAGEVPIERCARMVRKFHDLYLGGQLTKDSRYRRKKAALGNAQLLMWVPSIGTSWIRFVLLVSAVGDHPAHQLENLKDARDRHTRIFLQATFDDTIDYELVQHSRPGNARSSWSWKITEHRLAAYRHALLKAVHRHEPDELRRLLISLSHAPGFALIRRQVFELRAMAKRSWRQRRDGPFPVPTIRIPYVSRVRHVGIRLSALISDVKRRSVEPLV
jgi:hypothetical protein